MIVICLAGIAYYAIALYALLRFTADRPSRLAALAPQGDVYAAGITILKPIAGLEVELFENLCSFCEQGYPKYQVIFGVHRSDDPAIDVIQRVVARYPERDLTLVVGERTSAGNPKVANLANMLPLAKYGLFFIADADMRVDRSYLATVAAEFDDDRVGAVTCLYAGTPRGGTASQLGAMHVNDQFAPSVLVATLGGSPRYCFGSTMAVRRTVLDAIGGLSALAPHLADDYMLGALVAAQGYRVALASYVVCNVIAEENVPTMLRHELRWARTIRSVQTFGYVCSFVTFPLPFALIWVGFAMTSATAWTSLITVLALRLATHYAARNALGAPEIPVWLLPLRDCLGLGVWAAGLFGKTVTWKNETLEV